MSDDEMTWVAAAMMRFDAILFVWVGRYGAQPVLMPRSLMRHALASTLQQV